MAAEENLLWGTHRKKRPDRSPSPVLPALNLFAESRRQRHEWPTSDLDILLQMATRPDTPEVADRSTGMSQRTSSPLNNQVVSLTPVLTPQKSIQAIPTESRTR